MLSTDCKEQKQQWRIKTLNSELQLLQICLLVLGGILISGNVDKNELAFVLYIKIVSLKRFEQMFGNESSSRPMK